MIKLPYRTYIIYEDSICIQLVTSRFVKRDLLETSLACLFFDWRSALLRFGHSVDLCQVMALMMVTLFGGGCIEQAFIALYMMIMYCGCPFTTTCRWTLHVCDYM